MIFVKYVKFNTFLKKDTFNEYAVFTFAMFNSSVISEWTRIKKLKLNEEDASKYIFCFNPNQAGVFRR